MAGFSAGSRAVESLMDYPHAPEGLQQGFDLSGYNSLGLPSQAEMYLPVFGLEQLRQVLSWAYREQVAVNLLGQGSNLVLAPYIEGLVCRVAMPGVSYRREGDDVYVRAGAGVLWSALVDDTVAKGYSGLENLSLIPGTVGAAPIQNIGAYGVELAQRVYLVETIDRQGRQYQFTGSECGFRYRDSFFKTEWRGEHIVTALTLKLSTEARPVLSYEPLAAAFEGKTSATSREVAEEVKRIRRSKLPDPKVLPNAGSFFKNPVVSESDFQRLRSQFSDIPHWPTPSGVKLSAGWLLQQAGWKGRREGALGMHSEQALVLVHYGGANGQDVESFSQRLQWELSDRFGISLEREPGTLGTASV